MEPREAVVYLESLRRYGVKKGFGRVYRLLDALGNPHEELRTVTVAGTNGKGSTARTLESCLRHDGRKTGLYTSPHMYELGERVRVDGERMRRRRIAEFVERVRPAVEEMTDEGDPPTFFEVTTAMALDEFARCGVDVAVLEVGMGGRLDTTRVADSDLAAVTSVGLEHTDVLGETIEEVAREVCDVVPDEGTCVVGTTGDALDVARGLADGRGASLRVVGDDVSVESNGRDGLEQRIEVGAERDYSLRTPLLGEHQATNVAVAVALAEKLGVSHDAVVEGVRRADWQGRFEVVGRNPLVVLDAAHNPAAAAALSQTLDGFDGAKRRVVFGAMADKDVSGMARELDADRVYAVEPAKDRAETAGTVAEVFASAGADASVSGDVDTGVTDALADAAEDDTVVVTGSLWTVAEARRRWCDTTTSAAYTTREDAKDALRTFGAEGDAEAGAARTVRLHGLTHDEARQLERAADRVGASVALTPATGDMCVDAAVTATYDEYAALADEGTVRKPADEVFSPSSPTRVMGILNTTPDSFYDGGEHDALEDAVERAYEMDEAGAEIIDVGGESTRPGADAVPVEDELRRVVPVIERIADDLTVSVDTRKPEVARRALEAGAEIVNDVTGLANPELRRVVADAGCRVVVMDSLDVPVNPSRETVYDDVVDDVARRLSERVLRARRAGIDADDIIVDPGIGFGKGAEGDIELLARTDELATLGYPLLVGASRKSCLGALTGRSKDERLEASVAVHSLAAAGGASYVRVHDVRETVRALEAVNGLRSDEDTRPK